MEGCCYRCRLVALYTSSDEYSTDEIIVGTWIDGKPIYRKTIECNPISSASRSHYFPHGVTNIDTVINVWGTRYSQSSRDYRPIVSASYANFDWMGSVVITQTDVLIESGSGVDSIYTSAYVTFEYTKTSD